MVDEQRIVSVVVALGQGAGSDRAQAERLRIAGARFGARVELLTDGTTVATLSSRGSARDQAMQAARCALTMRDMTDRGLLALATGRVAFGVSGLVGEVIERATALLRSRKPPPQGPGRRRPPIVIDTTTASLLDAQFEVVGDADVRGLRRERPDPSSEVGRTLLGRPTPFVGREREMETLEAVFRECVEENVAQAVLVCGPSGAGKSRLRQELLWRLRCREDRVEAWIARGDPMSAGSALGMISQLVRAAAGMQAEETLRARQGKLAARLSRHVPEHDVKRVTEFLGELSGARFSDAGSVQLAGARRSAVLMGDQMRRAWEEFLAAECSAGPVTIVLEDLHWGDLPTVNFIDGALRNLRDKPLMVLAFAQPDVHRLFPDLWSAHPMTELRLGELPRRASESLVRQLLGSRVSQRVVDRIVDHAAGNAFYLEELIRGVAEGCDDMPPSVLAMVQARLSALDPEARCALRVASVFGSTFWKGGVASLVGELGGAVDVGTHLGELTRRELVAPRKAGRFADEYVFRHAVVREAAYDMLPDADRALAHKLAGAWLEQAGESDATALAEQFERGGEPSRAAFSYVRAATQALEGNDLEAVLERVERGIACGAEGEQLGELLVLQAEARSWRGELDAVESSAKRALALVRRESPRWYEAASALVSASVRLWHLDGLAEIVDELGDESVGVGAGPARVTAWAQSFVPLVLAGLDRLAGRLFTCIERAPVDLQDPSVEARVHQARATRAIGVGDFVAFLTHTEAVIHAFEAAGDLRSAAYQRSNLGYAKITLGCYAQAEATLREGLASAERMGLPAVATFVRENLGIALAHRGALHEARAVEERAIAAAARQGETFLTAFPRVYLAEIFALAGSYESAERAAREALASVGERVHEVRLYVLGVLAHVLLARRRIEEARAAADEAMDLLAKHGAITEGEAMVRLAHAEALYAGGDHPSAREAIGAARIRLLARADKITDPELRQSFLENVEYNARTLRRARDWALTVSG